MAPNAENTSRTIERSVNKVVRDIDAILEPKIPSGPAVIPQKYKGRGNWIASVTNTTPVPTRKKCPVINKKVPIDKDTVKTDNTASEPQIEETTTAVRNLEKMLMVMPTWRPMDEAQPLTSTNANDEISKTNDGASHENAVQTETLDTPASPESLDRFQSDDEWENIYEEYDQQLAKDMQCFAEAYNPLELLDEPQHVPALQSGVPEPRLAYIPRPIIPELRQPVVPEPAHSQPPVIQQGSMRQLQPGYRLIPIHIPKPVFPEESLRSRAEKIRELKKKPTIIPLESYSEQREISSPRYLQAEISDDNSHRQPRHPKAEPSNNNLHQLPQKRKRFLQTINGQKMRVTINAYDKKTVKPAKQNGQK